MTEDTDAAANQAAIAARKAVKAQSRSSRSYVPLLLVAFAILSGIYLFMTDTNEPAQPTAPMPVPHVRAPGGASGTPPATPAP